jgi:O-antigen/teichoic acid export membrane protein
MQSFIKAKEMVADVMALTRKSSSEHSFRKHVLTLLSGTALAQILPIALTPIITRIFSPSDLGEFAIFVSIATICAVAATMRYSYALLLPEKDLDATHLALFCVGIAASFSCLLALLVFGFKNTLTALFSSDTASGWLYLVPISMFLSGLQITLYSLANRRREFKRMSISKVAQACGSTLGAIALAATMEQKVFALLYGYLAGQTLAVATLLGAMAEYCGGSGRINAEGLSSVALRYRKFAFISLPSDLLNSLSNQIPIFLIAYYFSQAVVGQYNLTFRVVMGPLSIIGVALLDVFKERAARDFSRTGDCRAIFLKTAKSLAWFGIPPLLLLCAIFPWVFAFIFGDEWREAGEYARILTPLFISRFVTSSLSYIIYIAEKQIYDLLWQISLFLIIVGTFYFGGKSGDFRLTLAIFSWLYTGMYAVYFIMNFRFTIRSKE